jgi:hypothetical protein
MNKRFAQVVEIDIDQCTLEFGVGACLATFGPGVVRKCYNSDNTCQFKQYYNKGVNTLRFCDDSYPLKNGNYIPALVKVGGYEQEINIAGFSDKIGGLGVRASVKVTFRDFPYRDTLTDKYFAGRMDGTAQTNEPGYDPLARGSFWTKFKARNPNYAGRPLRVLFGHYSDAGLFVAEKTRHYVMDDMMIAADGTVTIEAKDILSLADDKKALAPRGSQGRVLADMTAVQGSLTLSPAGIGDAEYPASGFLTVGSEVMRFTRAGDVMTVTRGQKGTVAATHTANSTVQLCFDVDRVRADTVLYMLLVDYGNIPAGFINFPEWQAEFDRWGSTMVLSATICRPNGVSKLIAEINQLGITIWWDEVAQKIRLRLNRPADTAPAMWSDRNNIISISNEDNDDERATRVEMWTVQIDPTKELNKDNFLRGYNTISVSSESPNAFNGTRTQTIYNRWLNHGADATAKIITGRLLNRYKRAPVTYKVKVDVKDDPSLADVVSLSSYIEADITGKPVDRLTEVFYRADDKNGSTVDVKLQMFQFDARYGLIAENTRGNYNVATDAEKLKGSYFVGPTLLFGDATGPYQFA